MNSSMDVKVKRILLSVKQQLIAKMKKLDKNTEEYQKLDIKLFRCVNLLNDIEDIKRFGDKYAFFVIKSIGYLLDAVSNDVTISSEPDSMGVPSYL